MLIITMIIIIIIIIIISETSRVSFASLSLSGNNKTGRNKLQ